MDRTIITADDEGKRVVNATGDEIGMITEVDGDIASVDPDPGLAETISSKLGWSDADDEDFELHSDHVRTVTDKEVRLKE